MNKQGWSRQVLLKYSLLQLPGLALLIIILILLRHWINIPNWAIWIFISLSLIVDAIMFPFVWRAYDKGNQNSMAGSQGVAVDRLSPSGYVRINGELWHAKVFEGNSAIEKGEVVMVKSMHGLTLFVQSDKKEKT
jgi:membrane-bound ClpP family serine protease